MGLRAETGAAEQACGTQAGLWRDAGAYGLATLLCLLAIGWYLRLWDARLDVPFYYGEGGDVQYTYMLVKSIVENGWYLRNPALGAPGVLFMHDYPFSDHLHNLLIRFIGVLAGNFGLTVNLFYIATFFLAVWTSLYAMRHFGVSRGVAVGASLIFAFLPYHFLRGQAHLYLGGYYVVPLTALMLIELCEGLPLLFQDRPGRWWPALARPNRSAALSALTCLLTAWSGMYYAFFGCLLAGVVGLMALIGRRNVAGMLNALTAGVLIGLLVGVGLIPNVLYWREVGKNSAIANRPLDDLPTYSLKLSSLLKPYPQDPLREVKTLVLRREASPLPDSALYLQTTQVDTVAYPGIAGLAGLGVLLAVLFLPGRPRGPLKALWPLSRLGLATFLIGMPYGFGQIIGILITTKIRAYNRISVYLVFFGILGLALVVDYLLRRLQGDRRWCRLLRGGLALAVVLCLYEQMPPPLRFDQETQRNRFDDDRGFYQAIERSLPTNAMVFQLPHVAFPEHAIRVSHSPLPYRSYRHFKGYLHTTALRWSGGAMHGREIDRWQSAVASQPIGRLLKELRRAGFAGLTVDRDGYEDQAAAIEAELIDLLESQPMRSRDERLLFFRLSKDPAPR